MKYTFSRFSCAGNSSLTTVDPEAPAHFLIDFQTDIDGIGKITVNITRSWAPLGADHLYALVKDGFYDGAAFFRVVGGFVLQFGIAGTPAMNRKWATPIRDDPVVMSNKQFTLTYATAGPNTRTTQLFINYKDNGALDAQGFAPVGKVTEGSEYLSRVHDPTPGDSNGVDQEAYSTKGDTWIREEYPEINFITKATIRS
jgi:cyclophilin family peptidyl-prolyl cis-trans isomerase